MMFTADWHYAHPRMKKARAEKLAGYANQYLLPALEDFPRARGRVCLSLRSYGFLFDFEPMLRVTVSESGLDTWPAHKLRFTTAYMLAHFELRDYGVELLGLTERRIDQQATVLALARGYALDFLRTFQTACGTCGRPYALGGFRCDRVYPSPPGAALGFDARPCQATDDRTTEKFAASLQVLAANRTVFDDTDFTALFAEACG